ncbi:PREDICTED: UBX domain-containing protein 1-like isoform X2 [Lupinus angustifolius]|uniref:UBX domain-containing protein 1-like isoform X2 n=1 Tax=Lupinus angustifolius TaxID=3871 RepID=UPI00092EB1A7|nr:PREDICTED: UBX domain-containing protein 1-like isoform X2 [Lupinus angustifolius]
MSSLKVNEKLLKELESMGIQQPHAIPALYYSGNTSVEKAISWLIHHDTDSDIDEMPLVDVDIPIESTESFPTTEEMRITAEKLRKQMRKRKEEEEKKIEKEREKERIQAGKKLMEAKRIAEEAERKRYLALKKAEKEEEKKARQKVLQKLEQDKLNRRSIHSIPSIPSEVHEPVRSSATAVRENKNLKPDYTTAKVDHLRECLRSLKRNLQGENARVRRAFETLLIYIGNVAKNPDDERYRMIRLSNPVFQERIGSLKDGVEFLELCGFERRGDFLYIPHKKIDTTLLNSAGYVLNSALTNPFFGALSTCD